MVKGHDINSFVQENKHIYSKNTFFPSGGGARLTGLDSLPPGGEDNQGGGKISPNFTKSIGCVESTTSSFAAVLVFEFLLIHIGQFLLYFSISPSIPGQ